MKNNYILTVVVALVVGVAAFFAGAHFSSSSSAPGQAGNARFGTRGGGGARMFNGAIGTIVSVTGNNLSLQAADGSSKVVFFDPAISVTKTVPGSASDLKVGTTVFIMGNPNSDGSLTASAIQIRPLPQRLQNVGTNNGTQSGQ